MKRAAAILALFLLAGLILADRAGIIERFLYPAANGKVIRLLSISPEQVELSSPLWDFRTILRPDWKILRESKDLVDLVWSGSLDSDPAAPGLEVRSATAELRRFPGGSPPEDSGPGFLLREGREILRIPHLAIPADPETPLSFPLSIPDGTAVIAFEARANGESLARLRVSLGNLWSATLEAGGNTWTPHRFIASRIPEGTQSLTLACIHATEHGIPLRGLRVIEPSAAFARIPKGVGPPFIRFRPAHPEDELFAKGARACSLGPSVRAPWAVYDEDERWVRPVERSGVVRTALFLPTPSRWSVEVEALRGHELEFYPRVESRAGKAVTEALVSLYVEPSGGERRLLWREPVSSEGPSTESYWTRGVRVPLGLSRSGRVRIHVETESKDPLGGTVAAAVAEPRLVPPRGVPPSTRVGRNRPNVILISIDTLRADALSVLGYRRKTSPWMERFFGEEGIRFTRAEAPCTWTLPSHASLFLSQYLSRHGVVADSVKIPSESTLLAEHFAREGYDTAAFVDGGFIDASYGFHQGFGFYDQQGGRFAGILPRAGDWLRTRDQGAPFLLFLHTYDVHAPYAAPEPYRSRFLEEGVAPPTQANLIVPEAVVLQTENRAIEAGKPTLDSRYAAYWRALYDGGVSYVDHMLEEFFSDLENSRLLGNTVVVLLSDHGESFYEHGSWAHSWNVYQELTHVPILIRLPDKRYAGSTREERVSLLDVIPTLFDVLGWKPPNDWQGRSLLPLVRGESRSEPRRIFCELHRDPFIFSAVYLKNTKYIATRRAHSLAPAPKHGGREVYDLAADPSEIQNRAAEPAHQATEEFHRAEKALALMRGFREREGEAEHAELDSEDVEELERLGYMR